MLVLQRLGNRYAVGILAILVSIALTLGTLAYISAQNTRADAIRTACLAQNQRHTNTVRELDTLLTQAEQHAAPAQRRQIRTSRTFTVLLIDALAPYQDCNQVVTNATH